MKYKIYNKLTGEFEDDAYIVTQEGEVAYWDDSRGWSTDIINQDDYNVTVIDDE